MTSIVLLFWGLLGLCTFFTTTADAQKEKFPIPKIKKGNIGDVKPLNRDEFEKIIKNLPPEDIKLLDDHVPMLFIDNSLGPVNVAKDSSTVRMEWNTVLPISGIYIRVRDRPFTAPCPPDGTAMDRGIADLDAADGFSSPDRIRSHFTFGTNLLHIEDPSYRIGSTYYFQGCQLVGDVYDNDPPATFTGLETNTVEMNIVEALPDLVVTDIIPNTARNDMGRVLIKIDDLNKDRRPRVLANEYDYEITAESPGLDSVTSSGTYSYTDRYWGLFMPGSETPGDTSDDFRIPDNGHTYNVSVRINPDRTLPETTYTNNSFEKELRVRGKRAWVVIERIHVRDDCDNISPGDWVILFGVLQGRNEVRSIHPRDGSMDMESGETKDINLGLPITVKDDLPIEIAIAAEDCDMDGPIAFVLPSIPTWGTAVASWVITCGGEEWYELSGHNADFTGWGRRTLTPEEWKSDREFDITTENGDCGRNAFTATIRIARPYEAEE